LGRATEPEESLICCCVVIGVRLRVWSSRTQVLDVFSFVHAVGLSDLI